MWKDLLVAESEVGKVGVRLMRQYRGPAPSPVNFSNAARGAGAAGSWRLWRAHGVSFWVSRLRMEGTSAMAVAIIPCLMGLDAPNHSEVFPSRGKVGEIGGFDRVEERVHHGS